MAIHRSEELVPESNSPEVQIEDGRSSIKRPEVLGMHKQLSAKQLENPEGQSRKKYKKRSDIHKGWEIWAKAPRTSPGR